MRGKKDLTKLKSIEEYICCLPDVPIRFLVTDIRILELIKEIGLDWSTTFPFYDIIQTFNAIYSQFKTNLAEIFEFMSIHDAPQQNKEGQTELLETSNKLSQIVGKFLDQFSEFNLILNKEELINTANVNKADGWVDSAENPEKQLDDEEVWGETAENKDTDQQKELPSEQQQQIASQNVHNTLESHLHAQTEKRERSRSRSRSRSYEKKERQSQEKSTPSEAGKQQSSTYSEQQPQYSQNTHFSSRQGRNEDTQEEPDASDSGFYLRLRGLPFNARERELFDFLGLTLEPDQIFFRYDPMGRFLGECVLRLIDQKQQERITSMHMRNMGKRYIEVFPANKSDFVRAQESQSFEGDRSAEDPASGSSYDSEFLKTVGIVKVRGLPYESSDEDIQSFFRESTIISNGIQKVFEGRRPSGEAFILFASKSDANKALEKDKQRMGSRYIEIFLCHPKEYTNYIKSRKSFSGGYQGNNYNSGYSSGGYNQNYHQGGYSQGEYSRGGSSYGGRYDKYPDSNRYENNRYGGYNNRNDNGTSPNNGGQQGYYRKPYQSRYGEEGSSRYGDDKYGSKPAYNSNSRPYNNYNKYDPNKSRYNGGKRDDYNSNNYQSYDASAATQGYNSSNQSYSQQSQYPQDTSANGLSDASQQQSYPYYGSYQYASTASGSAPAASGYYPSDQPYQQYPQAYQQQYSSQYYQQGVQSQPDGYSQQQNYGQPSQSAQAGVVPANSYYPQAGQTYDPSANYSGQHAGRQQY